MADFTYELPDEKKFLFALQQTLLRSNKEFEVQVGEKLKGIKCTIATSNQYSGERWNAYATDVHFYVPIDNLDFYDKEVAQILVRTCDRIMPKEAGFDVKNVYFAPILDNLSVEPSLTDDLDEIKSSTSLSSFLHLPDDIREKGKEMAEVYVYLYCVENSIRLFIEKVCTESFGEDYLTKINIPSGVKKSIQVRKDLEVKNQWISVRGNSDLFYLDFKELANIIIANWETFKGYFPDQHWLNVKIEELGNCRNLIAHNSYISDMEREVIRLNYNQIIKQIRFVEAKKTIASSTDSDFF